jgi:tetraacyldisaccharide 4'-kinase
MNAIPALSDACYQPDQPVGVVWQILAAFYRRIVEARLLLYQWHILPTRRLPVPVISLGNLTTGGTGKTPLTLSLAQYLERKGLRVAVLSRGYGRSVRTRCHQASGPEYGDEPWWIQSHLNTGQVFVGSDRVFVGHHAIKDMQPDVILLDDGYQYLRLYRDLNLLLVDGERQWGNGHLLPAGPLREPIKYISRSHAILMTKTVTPEAMTRLQAEMSRYPGNIPVWPCPIEPLDLWHADSKQLYPLSLLRHAPTVLLSGIANPDGFETMVMHITENAVFHHARFPDHVRYSHMHLANLDRHLQQNPTALLVTTEKDWVKLDGVLPLSWRKRTYILRLMPQIDWEPLLLPWLSTWGLA